MGQVTNTPPLCIRVKTSKEIGKGEGQADISPAPPRVVELWIQKNQKF